MAGSCPLGPLEFRGVTRRAPAAFAPATAARVDMRAVPTKTAAATAAAGRRCLFATCLLLLTVRFSRSVFRHPVPRIILRHVILHVAVHPILIPMFGSFRTQPLEILSADSVCISLKCNSTPGTILGHRILGMRIGCTA